MITFTQLSLKRSRRKKRRKIRPTALLQCPQKKGSCTKVYTASPKKPNSAVRKIAKVKLSTGRQVIVGIPGQGHDLRLNSVVLVRGGRVNDVPGVQYKVIRGLYGSGWLEDFRRSSRRSKYGVPRPEEN